MLEQVLSYLNNFFVSKTLPEQEYTITGGSVEIPDALNGQYIRIVGSVMNDGVYQYPPTELTDETFTGMVQLLAIPNVVLLTVQEVENWAKKDANQPTAYTSESFAGYSYSKATNANGLAAGWQDVFRSQLAPYRKMKQR